MTFSTLLNEHASQIMQMATLFLWHIHIALVYNIF